MNKEEKNLLCKKKTVSTNVRRMNTSRIELVETTHQQDSTPVYMLEKATM